MTPRNLFDGLPEDRSREAIERLLEGGAFRLERIVSFGQTTPDDEWFDQEQDEWVLLISGAARMRFEGEPQATHLRPGDYLHIPAHRRHRVEWTAPGEPTVWLALHCG